MEIYHKLETIDGIKQTVIYVKYPDEYEFSLDFDSMKQKVSNVADKIREYALKNIGNISDNTVLLILNGVVVGTLLLTQLTNPTPDKALSPRSEIATTIQNPVKTDETKKINETEKIKETEKTESLKNVIPIENTNIEKQANSKPQLITPKVVVKQNIPPVVINTKPIIKPTPQPSKPIIDQGKIINLKLATGKVIQIGLEEYVIGVVGSEMPAEFSNEALKAQAVAARTFALKKTSNGGIITATTADQVYKTNNELKQMWKNSYNTYYTKVKNSVNATKGVCALYNNKYIDALYFSTSNGKTEDSKNVWGNSLPYLKSVESPFDVGVRGFKETKSISMDTISKKLGVNLNSISQIKINSKTEGNRVKNITVCGKSFTGVQIRSRLGLRSADFDIAVNGNNIVFTTKGYGHGVGMSQYGANLMAKSGSNYTQILKHYYSGITISKI
ncbi:MAG: stage II sporulation protein D [Clostridia bacterium]